jgi:hypothetical protein
MMPGQFHTVVIKIVIKKNHVDIVVYFYVILDLVHLVQKWSQIVVIAQIQMLFQDVARINIGRVIKRVIVRLDVNSIIARKFVILDRVPNVIKQVFNFANVKKIKKRFFVLKQFGNVKM